MDTMDQSSSWLGKKTRGKKPSDKKGLLRIEEALAEGKGKAASVVPEEVIVREFPKKEAFEAESQLERGFSASLLIFCQSSRMRKRCLGEGASSSRGEVALRKPSFDETKKDFWAKWGPIIMVHQSRSCLLSQKSESPLSSLPPSCGLALSFMSPSVPDLPSSVIQSQFPMENRSPYPNQLPREFNPIMYKPNLPNEVSNLITVSQGDVVVSPSGKFQKEVGIGLGSRKKRRVVKNFLRLEIPDIVMIQETKNVECDRRFVGSVWTVRNKEWAALPAYGASENLGGSSLTSSMKDFDGFIRECKLFDPPLRNAPFTWSNIQESFVYKRLDRFLYSNEWEHLFPQSLQEVLPRWTSDHWPIVLDTNPFKWGSTPFRFENMWLQHPSFKDALEVGGEIFKEMGGKVTILIANEIVNEKKRSGEEGVVFKIDFEKAYDHVSLDFLDHVLEKKGFSPKWRKWMRDGLSTVSFAVLVNGNAKRLAELLDCKASSWPILYLGLHLGRNPKACGFWDPVIERISRRLDGWKKAYLSFGGKRDHLVSWDVVCNPKAKRGLGFWEDFYKESCSLREIIVEMVTSMSLEGTSLSGVFQVYLVCGRRWEIIRFWEDFWWETNLWDPNIRDYLE
ncbi:hypothetical protein CK203_054361 [Vitis vinifera]|uniref:Uncharacterized protein n=1 Tax=Vitis vinifera TaxID=29760 RepID=A0A438H0E5_VITVI|nr:hypothetical protein CK203_054361 [Vitis vinifera]